VADPSLKERLIKIGAKVAATAAVSRSSWLGRNFENSLRRSATDRGTAAAADYVNSVKLSCVARSIKTIADLNKLMRLRGHIVES
jgi:hypothetical protein